MKHGYGYFEEDTLATVSDFGLWKRILSYTGRQWRGVGLAVILALFISGTSLALPYIVRIAIDSYIINEELAIQARFAGLTKLALPYIGLIALGFAANFLQVTLLEWTSQNIMHRLRQHLFSHLQGLDLSFYNRNPIGKLVTRLTNDIQNMHEMFTSVIVTLFNDLIRIVGILGVLLWMNWRLALIMSLLIPVMIIYTIWFSKLARKVFREIRTGLARINSYLQESLTGVSIIQLFLRTKETYQKFNELNQAYFQKTLYQIKIFGIFMPLIEVMSAFSIGLIIWYGGSNIIAGQMTLGILVAFISYMRLFFQPLRELSQKYSIVQSAMASAERIFQLLDTKSTLPVQSEPLSPSTVKGIIDFRNVSFGYEPGEPVIKNFTHTVQPGETLAIVGATGAGKSTIINLLERFYDPDQGEVCIDGHDLRRMDPHWLRKQVGLVMQDVFIIPASIKKNILLDRQMSDNDLQRIIADAQLTEVVSQLPQSMDTRIGEGGMELSAGQKQLLAFARVLARDPRILVLDEATSNVDTETEILIERAIEITLANRTSIVIAHRLSTIRRADRILVMDQGRIVEQGTHESLMDSQGIYYTLQRLQNGEHFALA